MKGAPRCIHCEEELRGTTPRQACGVCLEEPLLPYIEHLPDEERVGPLEEAREGVPVRTIVKRLRGDAR